jgi:hypothetical protein
MKEKMKLFIFRGPTVSCSFKPESQNSSSHYRELHNQAQALMQAKKKMKKIIKLFTHRGPVACCSFKPGSQNSSSCYQELHNLAQAMMQMKRKMKEKMKHFTLRGLASSRSFKPESQNSSSRYQEQGCHTGRLEAFWQANWAGRRAALSITPYMNRAGYCR